MKNLCLLWCVIKKICRHCLAAHSDQLPRPSIAIVCLNFLMTYPLWLCLCVATMPLSAWEDDDCDEQSNLMHDLLIVDYWNKRINDRLPVTYNQWLQGGYFVMPSARMGCDGEMGLGYSYVPPYRSYNLRIQIMDRIELSGNYRIFKGIIDPVFGSLGFGDFSDKGVNAKLSLFSPEDSGYQLPGLAIGFDDTIGTKSFRAYYIVLTKVWLNYNFEISLGYGMHRLKGLFGGMMWFPFRQSGYEYLKGLSFGCEYDTTPYHDPHFEKHPGGRVKKSPLNIGLKYRLWDCVDMSLAYIRGDALTFTVSGYYNLGQSKGFFPKIEDPLPYKAPVNFQEIGPLRPEDVFIQDYNYALLDQGFELREAWISYDTCCQKILRLYVINLTYREEKFVRHRLNAIISALTPDDIDKVIVVIETFEVAVQEYHYRMDYVRAYREQEIGPYELDLLTPTCEARRPNPYEAKCIFKQDKEWWNFELKPKMQTLFGSSKGKFKYAFGLSTVFNGYLWNDIYYSVSFGYFIISNLYDIGDMDRLNPSQLINVNTDIINYFKQKCVTIDEAYIEKIWNHHNGVYSRLTIGWLNVAYGGVGGEVLYYPVRSLWAIGVEGAIVKRRMLQGIGFSNTIRKLHNFTPEYVPFLGSQFFLNMYYDLQCVNLQLKVAAGKFLANDYGARFEVTRYFPSGVRLALWYTYTNGHDVINGQIYHDTGVYLSIPWDIIYTKSSRSRWGYGSSAWLRDVGFKTYSGTELYHLINEQRQ